MTNKEEEIHGTKFESADKEFPQQDVPFAQEGEPNGKQQREEEQCYVQCYMGFHWMVYIDNKQRFQLGRRKRL